MAACHSRGGIRHADSDRVDRTYERGRDRRRGGVRHVTHAKRDHIEHSNPDDIGPRTGNDVVRLRTSVGTAVHRPQRSRRCGAGRRPQRVRRRLRRRWTYCARSCGEVGGWVEHPDGAAVHRLNLPTDAAVDAAGNVYVVDRNNRRVLRLAAGSNTQTVLPVAGVSLAEVAVDTAGTVYITDQDTQRVVELPAG